MEPNTPNESNNQGSSATSAKSSSGPLIGTIVIITLLVIGGLYFWMQEPKDKMADLPFIPGDSGDEAWMPETSSSDEAAAIEAELSATNMNAFETQTNADATAASESL